jgi:outer membrane immunogenic protein
MQRVGFAGFAVAALLGAQAMAADLKPPLVYYPTPAAAAYFNWSGCYLGGDVGGLWSRTEWTDQTFNDPAFGANFGSTGGSGAIGGVQGNCSYQIAGWVLGAGGSYDWTNAGGGTVNSLAGAVTEQAQIRKLAAITGRVGYAWDRVLGYVKAGGASLRRDYTVFFVGPSTGTFSGPSTGASSETRGGWTIGIGAEYAFLDWLTGFAEFDYYNFGSSAPAFNCVTPCPLKTVAPFITTVAFDATTTISVFRIGVNFTIPDAWDPQRSRSSPRIP